MHEPHELLEAITAGDADAVKALVAEDPSLVNSRGADGVSAVMASMYGGKPAIARLLTEHGAVLDFFDAAALGAVTQLEALLTGDPSLVKEWSTDGFLATHLSAFFGQPHALSLLLERGGEADTMARHPFAVTPLHSAVANGDPEKAVEMARILIAAGADVNARQGGGEAGFTPLMAAAQNGNVALTQLLLDSGADRSIKTAEGKTALDFAREGKHDAVAALLERP